MIINEIEHILQDYTNWLKDKTVLKQIDARWIEITTPYLDRHNDYLQIYARKDGNKFVLTDDGYIIHDLINSGCSLNSPKRQQLLHTTLNGFGIHMKDEQLIVHSDPEEFSQKKHNIIQAMLSVNDLFYLASPYIENLFLEDVTKWLDISNIRYTPNLKFAGKSGYDHVFNFVIPKSRKQPERIVQTLTNPKKNNAENLVFKWLDTREMRSAESELFAVLNDGDNGISHGVAEAFKRYDIIPMAWSERENNQERLAG